MDNNDLKKWGKITGDWSAGYLDSLATRPVRPPTRPGDVEAALGTTPPEQGESVEAVFRDFESVIVPNVTNWQHPRFFAYFPSNNSPPSILGEWLSATMAAQGMIWQTSPAGTELELRMIDWLRQMIGLQDGWHGLIEGGASQATLSAILVAREKALDWSGKEKGLFNQPILRVYASTEAHSSIEKAVFLSGIGRENLVKIPPGDDGAMSPDALKKAIADDRAAGYLPCALVGVIGATGVGVSDNLEKILPIAVAEGLYSHIDAAWAGSALICPEFRPAAKGIELADSIVFNPHKWLMTNFDCSAHFVKSAEDLKKTMAITPAYLMTQDADDITDFSQMAIELGRRFRALKLWFVIRCYGVSGLQKIIRNHIAWANDMAERMAKIDGFEITTPVRFALFSFRLKPEGIDDPETLAGLNAKFVDAVNSDGTLYLTQTDYKGQYVIRVSIGTTLTREEDIDIALDRLTELAQPFLNG